MKEIVTGSVQDRKNLLIKVTKLLRQSLFVNAGYLTGVDIVNSLAGFVFWWMAARLYRVEDMGIASATLVAVGIISIIAGAGVGLGLVRFLPESTQPHRFLNTIFTFNIIVTLTVSGVFLAGLSLWTPSLLLLRQNILYMVGFIAYSVAISLISVMNMAFMARQQSRYQFLLTCLLNGSRLLLVIGVTSWGAAGLVFSIALSSILVVGLNFVILPQIEPGYRPRFEINLPDLVAILPYSIGNHFGGALMSLAPRVMPIMILEILGPIPSGYAYIAWMMNTMLTSPGIALSSAAFAEGSNSPQHLKLILFKSIIMGLGLTVPAAFIVGIAAPWFLWPFGDGYVQAATGLLRWLAVAAPLMVLAWLYFIYLRVQKRTKRGILLCNLDAITTIGVAAILIPHLGIAGSGIGLVVGNGLVVVIVAVEMMRGGILKGIGQMLKSVFALKPKKEVRHEASW